LLQANEQALNRLAAALVSGDGEAIATAARALRPPYARLFVAYG